MERHNPITVTQAVYTAMLAIALATAVLFSFVSQIERNELAVLSAPPESTRIFHRLLSQRTHSAKPIKPLVYRVKRS